MLNYVIYYVKLCDISALLPLYWMCIDVIVLEWYLISFLMIIIVFLFHYRGEHDNDNENDSEYVRWNRNECEHVGPVDPVGPVFWCQCYQI